MRKIIPLGLLLLVFGCGKRQERNIELKQDYSCDSCDADTEIVSGGDLPIPVGYKPISKQDNTEQPNSFDGSSRHIAKFRGELSVTQVSEFYRNEMERLGWELNDLSTQDEGMVVCGKGDKSCVISVKEFCEPKSKHASTEVSIFFKEICQEEPSALDAQAFGDLDDSLV